jgi:UDP-glucose:(heptosyl)LPS alpha-1,3-glucosyltransferase
VAAFLDAVARAGTRPWAIVVGRDKNAARYARRAATLGIAERVKFVGAVSDVRPYYAAADSFVLASLYDPQPNAALEAMACGLPVVTTPTCGVAELLVEDRSGYVRDALDVAGIAEAIERLEGGVALRIGAAARAVVEPYTPAAMAADLDALQGAAAVEMGMRARAAVEPFTPERMAREYLALYERLLRR